MPPTNSTLSRADTIAVLETPPIPVDVRDEDLADLARPERYLEGSLLGQGGMGEVRSVRDSRLGREVAVKVLHGGVDGPSFHGQRRFLREARVQGQLEHPTIVPVYDLEWHADGEARLYMKRVRGVTLEDVISALNRREEAFVQRFTRRRLLTAFVSVCRGIDYAHARGVVHRDIKPSNIMLGEYGEVHVLDWGIAGIRHGRDIVHADASENASQSEIAANASLATAKTMEANAGDENGTSNQTADGTLLGTPGYMAPEQARGDVALIDARSDVFALGAVLFELLTLEPLILGRSVMQKIEATLFMTEPRIPSSVAPNAEIPPELDAICAQCCASDPVHRFSSAGAIAEAVDRYLDGDRDLAARRALAQTHIDAAEEALQKAPEGDGEARAIAVRELTRALALDAKHKTAAERLGQLLMDVSGKMPKEAADELEAWQAKAAENTARISRTRAGGAVFMATLGLLMGVRNYPLAFLTFGGLMASVLLQYLWTQSKNEKRREYLLVASVLSMIITLIAMDYGFSPAIFVPLVSVANGLLILGQTNFRSRRLAMFLCTVPPLFPFAIAALGLSPWPFEISRDFIKIPAQIFWFSPTATMGILALLSLGMSIAPLIVVAEVRERLRSVEERVFLQSWHLRQLAKQSNDAGSISEEK